MMPSTTRTSVVARQVPATRVEQTDTGPVTVEYTATVFEVVTETVTTQDAFESRTTSTRLVLDDGDGVFEAGDRALSAGDLGQLSAAGVPPAVVSQLLQTSPESWQGLLLSMQALVPPVLDVTQAAAVQALIDGFSGPGQAVTTAAWLQPSEETTAAIDQARTLGHLLDDGDGAGLQAFLVGNEVPLDALAAELSAHIPQFAGITTEQLLARIEQVASTRGQAGGGSQFIEPMLDAIGPMLSGDPIARATYLANHLLVELLASPDFEATALVDEHLEWLVALTPEAMEVAADVFYEALGPCESLAETDPAFVAFDVDKRAWLASAIAGTWFEGPRADEVRGLVLGDAAQVEAAETAAAIDALQAAGTPEQLLAVLNQLPLSLLPAVGEGWPTMASEVSARFGGEVGALLAELLPQALVAEPDPQVGLRLLALGRATELHAAFDQRFGLQLGDYDRASAALSADTAALRGMVCETYAALYGEAVPAAIDRVFGAGSDNARALHEIAATGPSAGADMAQGVNNVWPPLRGLTERDNDAVFDALTGVIGQPEAIDALAVSWANHAQVSLTGTESQQAQQARAAMLEWVREQFPGIGGPSRLAAYAQMVLAPSAAELSTDAALAQFHGAIDQLYGIDRGSANPANWFAENGNPYLASQVTAAYETLSRQLDALQGNMPPGDDALRAVAESTYRLLGAMDDFLVARGEVAERDRALLMVAASLLAACFSGGASAALQLGARATVAVQAAAFATGGGAAAYFSSLLGGQLDANATLADVAEAAAQGAMAPFAGFGTTRWYQWGLNNMVSGTGTAFTFEFAGGLADGLTPAQALERAGGRAALQAPADFLVGVAFGLGGELIQSAVWGDDVADVTLSDGSRARFVFDEATQTTRVQVGNHQVRFTFVEGRPVIVGEPSPAALRAMHEAGLDLPADAKYLLALSYARLPNTADSMNRLLFDSTLDTRARALIDELLPQLDAENLTLRTLPDGTVAVEPLVPLGPTDNLLLYTRPSHTVPPDDFGADVGPSQVTRWVEGEEVTRDNFISWLASSFARSRGNVGRQADLLMADGVNDALSILQNFRSRSGWFGLNPAEKVYFLELFTRVSGHGSFDGLAEVNEAVRLLLAHYRGEATLSPADLTKYQSTFAYDREGFLGQLNGLIEGLERRVRNAGG
ncbi:MAG: hypothetical protein JNK82_35780 [Myxococcaceae bacterium]|nr:hypothetical protein [Myxococcaceae bacterium]